MSGNSFQLLCVQAGFLGMKNELSFPGCQSWPFCPIVCAFSCLICFGFFLEMSGCGRCLEICVSILFSHMREVASLFEHHSFSKGRSLQGRVLNVNKQCLGQTDHFQKKAEGIKPTELLRSLLSFQTNYWQKRNLNYQEECVFSMSVLQSEDYIQSKD